MKLREGIRFHDGTELDADDVVATFEAQLADPIISLAFKPGFDPDEPYRKIDDYTVEYRGVRPSARLPNYFASQLGMILPSEWLGRALADSPLNQMPVGTVFMIESRVQDEKTVLVRNPITGPPTPPTSTSIASRSIRSPTPLSPRSGWPRETSTC